MTATIVTNNAKAMYALIALLTSLEALLGVINACLPVLKPVFDRFRLVIPKRDNGTIKSFMSGSIPIMLRLSHPWDRSVGKSTLIDGDSPSPEPSEGAWIKDTAAPTPKVERMIGMKVAEIYVRKDVDIESHLSDDQPPLGRRREGSHDRW